jgi:hypothetical protein
MKKKSAPPAKRATPKPQNWKRKTLIGALVATIGLGALSQVPSQHVPSFLKPSKQMVDKQVSETQAKTKKMTLSLIPSQEKSRTGTSGSQTKAKTKADKKSAQAKSSKKITKAQSKKTTKTQKKIAASKAQKTQKALAGKAKSKQTAKAKSTKPSLAMQAK